MEKLINENLVELELDLNTKEEVIKHLHSLIIGSKAVNCPRALLEIDECQKCEICGSAGYLDSLFKREEEFATAVGELYAIPHGKCIHVNKPAVAFAKLKKEVVWDESENENAKYIFMIAIPAGGEGANQHIDILVNLSRKIMDDDFREGIENAITSEKVVELING